MIKYLNLLVFFILFGLNISAVFSQIGINTTSPQQLVHIDAKSDTQLETNISDDIVIDNNGNVGVGTLNPTNKLTIAASTGMADLHLPKGAVSGAVLRAADDEGRTHWVKDDSPIQLYTVVNSTGGVTVLSSTATYPKITKFTTVSYDNAKTIYGSEFGWDTANQQYVTPITGTYRISFSFYINTNTASSTTPIYGYVYKNGAICYDTGFILVGYTGGDVKSFLSGLVDLNEGDIIDFRIYSPTGNGIYMNYNPGFTYFMIESL